jgi:hypothetical protein
MAEAAAISMDIGEVVRDLNYLFVVWEASGELGAEAKRVLNLCREVEGLIQQVQGSSRIISAVDHVQSRLEVVAKIAAKYKGHTHRELFMCAGMARCRLLFCSCLPLTTP